VDLSEDIPASSPEAERATLGSMLIDRKACDRARLFLEPEDFYLEPHRGIYGTILKILRASESNAIDPVTVGEQLRADNNLGEGGGLKALRDLTEIVSTSDHIEHYARIVKKSSLERKIRNQLIITSGAKTSENIHILGNLIQTAEGLGAGRIFDFRQDLGEALEAILERREVGVKTGFAEIDEHLIGLERGDLMTIGARVGEGKTAIMTRMAVNMASKFLSQGSDDSVLYITTEMGRNQMVERVLPMATNIPLWRFRKNLIERADHRIINRVCGDTLSKLPLHIFDHSRPSISDIRSAITRCGCRVAFIDYLQRCHYPKADNRTYEIQEFLVRLKSFAQRSGVSIVQGCQLDRQRDKNAKAPPNMSELKDSGSIEAESDIVGLMWRNEKKDLPPTPGCDPIEFIVKKNRSGAKNKECQLELRGELIKVSEIGKAGDPVFNGKVEAPAPAPGQKANWWED